MRKILSAGIGTLSVIVMTSALVAQAASVSSPSTACISITKTLLPGSHDSSSGGQVSALQKFLKTEGSYTYPTITGVFGPVTTLAVQKFQQKNNLISKGTPSTTGFGAVGPKTRTLINAQCKGTSSTSSKISFYRILKIGDTGADVKALQMYLNKNPLTRIAQSGIGSPGNESTYYGAATAAAVKKFQELNKSVLLIPYGKTVGSGLIDQKTLAFLIKITTPSSTTSIQSDNPSPITQPAGNNPTVGSGVATISGGSGGFGGGGGGGGTIQPNDTTPPVLSSVTISSINQTSAVIAWTTDENSETQVEFGQSIQYGLSTDADVHLVTAHSVMLTGLQAGTTYNFRVKSKDAAGNQSTSGNFTFTTTSNPIVDNTPPVISNIVKSAITSNGAIISWSTNEAADSQISYGTTAAYGSVTTLDTNLVTNHLGTISNLNPSTTYHISIRSKDAAGNISRSADSTFTTLPPVVVNQAPIITSFTNNAVDRDTTKSGIQVYEGDSVRFSAVASDPNNDTLSWNWKDNGTLFTQGSGAVGDAIYTFPSGSAGTSYTWLLTVSDGTVSAQNSVVVEVINRPVTPDTTPPSISSVSSSNITTSGATITWATNEAATTQIEFGTSVSYGNTSALNSTLVTNHTVTILSGLNAGTVYHYRVKSADASGNLSVSPDFTFTTTAITVTNSVTSLTLINADSGADIRTLQANDAIDLHTLPTTNLNIRANTSPTTVGSVVFGYDSNTQFQTQSSAPYAFAGDTGSGYLPWTPLVGSHVITATPYSSSGGTGTAGTPLVVNLAVTDSTPTVTYYSVTASAGTGGTISPSGVTQVQGGGSQSYTITPNTGYSIASITVDGVTQTIANPFVLQNVTKNTIVAVTFTQNPVTDTQAPSVPAGLTASAGSSSQINLSWSASTDNVGVTGYKIFRNGGTTAYVTVTGTSYVDVGLNPSTTYTYTVAAVDAAGNVSAQSGSKSATTLVATPTGSGNTYYVATTGSDSANGSSATPWKTLQKAAGMVKAGDTVIVRSGNYVGFGFSAQGTQSQPITFAADPGATITTPATGGLNPGQNGINIEGNTSSYIIIKGFKITGGYSKAGIRFVNCNGCQMLNNEVANTGGEWGLFTTNSANMLIEGNIGRNSGGQHGIYMSLGSVNSVVRNNQFYGNNWDGIHMNTLNGSTNSGNLIEGNIVHDNLLAGMDLEGINNNTYRNNIIYGNGKHGITIHSQDQANTPVSTGNVFENNTILGNSYFSMQIKAADMNETVFNNILLDSNGNYGSIGVENNGAGLKSNYNIVTDNFSTNVGVNKMTLSSWRTATGQDQNSIIGSASNLFVNPAANDYHLKSGALAINAGTASFNGVSAPNVDKDGNGRPASGAYDDGAYEYGGVIVNPPVVTTYTITASSDTNGSISPAGATSVTSGNSQSYTITPHSGYQISNVSVDGASAGAVSSYTFSNVTANHTISVTFSAVVTPPVNPPTNPPTTPTGSTASALYHFDESSGTTLTDSSTNTYAATTVGSPSFVSGHSGNALSFNGSSQYAKLNATDVFDSYGSMTVAAWIKPNVANKFMGFFATDKSGATCDTSFEFAVNASGQFEVWASNGSCATSFRATAPISNPTAWHHVAYVSSASGNALYVDGVKQTVTYEVGSSATNRTFSSAPSGTNVYYIGTTPDSTERFNGLVDDLVVYNRALSDSEIASLVSGSTP